MRAPRRFFFIVSLVSAVAAASPETDFLARQLASWLSLATKSAFKTPPKAELAGAESMRNACRAILNATFSEAGWKARAEIARAFGAFPPMPNAAFDIDDYFIESKLQLGTQCELAGGRALLANTFTKANAVTLASEFGFLLFDQNVGALPFLSTGDDDERVARRMVLLGLARFFAHRAVTLHASELGATLDDSDAKSFPPRTLRRTMAAMAAPQYVIERFALEEERGLECVERVYAEGGADALRSLLASPPTESSDVLHPERFLAKPKARSAPLKLPIVPSDLGGGWTATYEGRIGEFESELILRLGGDAVRARLAADGIGLDAIAVFSHDGESERLYSWSIEAESAKDAAEVIDALKKLFDRFDTTKAASKATGKPLDAVTTVTVDPARTSILVRFGDATPSDAQDAGRLIAVAKRVNDRVDVVLYRGSLIALESLLPP